jgi:hypothetical protein
LKNGNGGFYVGLERDGARWLEIGVRKNVKGMRLTQRILRRECRNIIYEKLTIRAADVSAVGVEKYNHIWIV